MHVSARRGFGNPSFNRVWCNLVACTDADTVVSPDWLRYQIQHQPTDAICGTVTLDDFSHLSITKQQNI